MRREAACRGGLFIFFVLVVSALFPRAAWAVPQYEFVFTTAPFASAHASTVVELRNGDLLAAWFGGSAEGKPDVAIWSSRRTRDGWSAPVELAREPGVPAWNPVLFHTRDGRLWLYYKVGPGPSSWTAARRWSDDDGATWSPIAYLPAGLLGPVRAKPLVRDDGLVVAGSSVESYNAWAVWIDRSADNGATWHVAGPVTVPAQYVHPDPAEPRVGIIQPSIIALDAHHLRLYARPTSRIGRVCVADSYDDGATWTPAHPIDVQNSNSAIDVVRLRDGRIVLVYDDSPTQRTPLALAVSDDGLHFRRFLTVEHDPGEYSYPALIQTADGSLALTYTWKRERIRFVRVPLADVPR
ncbi:MAG: exo-alpha-sialidase [Candidatus Eremiobacteraeota bacterium]|nr:exo-alpha-sialidase [Candidatus Eremiobacteraeota bacterium]MBV9408357.1 exo-alpha-sialidase [Candidatus Eremiobacteraeota bacterium]